MTGRGPRRNFTINPIIAQEPLPTPSVSSYSTDPNEAEEYTTQEQSVRESSPTMSVDSYPAEAHATLERVHPLNFELAAVLPPFDQFMERASSTTLFCGHARQQLIWSELGLACRHCHPELIPVSAPVDLSTAGCFTQIESQPLFGVYDSKYNDQEDDDSTIFDQPPEEPTYAQICERLTPEQFAALVHAQRVSAPPTPAGYHWEQTPFTTRGYLSYDDTFGYLVPDVPWGVPVEADNERSTCDDTHSYVDLTCDETY